MKGITLITGGSRSGKSAHALQLADEFNRKGFIATAEAIDNEMEQRISNHKKERGEEYMTIEEPVQLAEAIHKMAAETEVILIDCLTVWLGNLSYHLNQTEKEEAEIASFIATLKNPPCQILIVTNELGMGIIPENRAARLFRDRAGHLNQEVASIADRVILVVSGIPVVIKEHK